MRPTSVTVGSATTSAVLPINWRAVSFRISIGCIISAGANLVYKVQHTFDNIYDPDVTPTWLDHSTLTGKVDNGDGSYISPITAVRLNVTSYTSGSVTMTIVSGG